MTKHIKIRDFCKAPLRYLKQVPFELHTKDGAYRVEVIGFADKNADEDHLPTKNVADSPNLPTKHACGCKVKETKLCKEHGRL